MLGDRADAGGQLGRVGGSSWVVYAMPKPPPRPSSGISMPSSSESLPAGRSARRAATSNPDESKICEPMCECSPGSLRLGGLRIRATASDASPLASEKPNFWSSWAVAMYSWVCASTPTVDPDHHLCVAPRSLGESASRTIS